MPARNLVVVAKHSSGHRLTDTCLICNFYGMYRRIFCFKNGYCTSTKFTIGNSLPLGETECGIYSFTRLGTRTAAFIWLITLFQEPLRLFQTVQGCWIDELYLAPINGWNETTPSILNRCPRFQCSLKTKRQVPIPCGTRAAQTAGSPI